MDASLQKATKGRSRPFVTKGTVTFDHSARHPIRPTSTNDTDSPRTPQMRRSAATITVLLLAMASTDLALARKNNAAPPPDPTQDSLMITAGFLNGHPDLRFRLLALEKRQAGKLDDAFRFFQRAAYYADKPSQGMVAEMLWN